MPDLKNKVDFSIIRYANCWEDPLILLEGLNVQTGEKVLSIASAGDNSFSLLTKDPELVAAVDVNCVQLWLTELKIAAIKNLNREEYLRFAGFENADDRLKVYKVISSGLSSGAKSYWENNSTAIENGIIYSGKFEKYFQYFSEKILPWIHSEKKVLQLLEDKPERNQAEFYDEKWNTWRWRLLFKIFFSRYIMGKYGRDPEFLKEVKVPVSEFIFNRAGGHLSSVAAQDNFILHFNLTGNFGKRLPHYVLPEQYEKVKANIERLVLFEGYAQDAASVYGKFDKMNLSNIFEYMDADTFRSAADSLTGILKEKGRMAYWNLMVPRKVSLAKSEMVYLKSLSENLKKKDKGFFYSAFIIDEKIR